MKKFARQLKLERKMAEASHLLFGPRGTGKSFLIREFFQGEALIINLLKVQDFRRLSENPSLLEEMVEDSSHSLVIIDEVQKIPALTDEVHRLIEERQLKFLLTGSSARKLKRGQANLLAGRARWLRLWPLTWLELEEPKVEDLLLWGGLPEVWQIKDRAAYLDSYIDSYLREEVMAEQLARNLIHYSRFLKTAALCSGQQVNYSKISSDSGVAVSTVKNYFEVLDDTMIGSMLEPLESTKKRKSVTTAKFYLFDIGVRNRLLDVDSLHENTGYFGECFEHLIFSELRSYLAYLDRKIPMYFWRTVNQQEVDFVVGSNLAVEVKASKKVSSRDAKHLVAFSEEHEVEFQIVVSRDPLDRKKEGIHYLHWKSFLRRLWNNDFIRHQGDGSAKL